jgi:EF hand
MLTITPFGTTQTDVQSLAIERLPKIKHKTMYDPMRRTSMKPYYYNQIGDICSNPLPAMVTYSTSPSSPLKYRPLGIKFNETTEIVSNTPKKPTKTHLYPTQNPLIVSLEIKEVFVMEDGTDIIGNKLIGFNYTISRKNMNKKEKQQEKDFFLEKSRLELNKSKKFKFIFSLKGKLYQFLQDIPYCDKVVVVSSDLKFQGPKISAQNDFYEDFKPDKSFAEQIEDKFRIKTLSLSNKNPESPYKSVLKTVPRTPRVKKRTLEELKLQMGQTAVKIDTELPKLFDIGMNKIKKKCGFNESDIHRLYGKYKMLVHLSTAKDPNHNIKQGIAKQTFIESYRGSPELSFVLSRLFDGIDKNQSGFIGWDEYLNSMDIMFNGTYEQQIDLFFKVYDTDENGRLSYEEIKNLCRLQLQNSDADNVIEELSQSFASLIFDITETSYENEITADKIKLVLGSQADKSLIEMFCSFSFIKN